MKRIINTVMPGVIVLMGFMGLAITTTAIATPSVYAANKQDVINGVDAVGGNETGNTETDFTATLKNVINILLFLIGTIAVIMIIIGGIRYTTSGGDQGSITGAKNTILYAIVGLVIAVMAYAIVNFFVRKL